MTDDEKIKQAMQSTDVKDVVLADAVIEGEVDGFKKELDVNGVTCAVIINKVNK